MAIIDGSNLILGRMSTIIAKRLLKGEAIQIVNAEKIVISGTKEDIVKKVKTKLNLQPKGNPMKGPKFSKMPDRIVKRAIRGMLPHKRERGKRALKNLRVYIGVPEKFEGEKFEKIVAAGNKLEKGFITVAELSSYFGVRV